MKKQKSSHSSVQRKSRTFAKTKSTKLRKKADTLASDWKMWTQSMSKRFLHNYALPLARLAENQLVKFQKQFNA